MPVTIIALFLAIASAAPIEIKFKARGYFFVQAKGRAASVETPRGQLTLLALPDRRADFEGYPGFRVVLVNRTGKTAELEAQDYRINIVREARDAAGRWRPIEYLPDSWCGNSYHHLYLRPGRSWSFTAPVYRGAFRTQMRFVLEQPGLRIVSNEFAGTINLEQFDKRQGHSPVSIMDPYDD